MLAERWIPLLGKGIPPIAEFPGESAFVLCHALLQQLVFLGVVCLENLVVRASAIEDFVYDFFYSHISITINFGANTGEQ